MGLCLSRCVCMPECVQVHEWLLGASVDACVLMRMCALCGCGDAWVIKCLGCVLRMGRVFMPTCECMHACMHACVCACMGGECMHGDYVRACLCPFMYGEVHACLQLQIHRA